MLRRVWLVAVSVLSLFLLSQYARAAEINSTNYTIYSGDINGDGMKDFVFSAKRGLLILHGKIATPIVFAKDIDLVIYRGGTGYSSPVALAFDVKEKNKYGENLKASDGVGVPEWIVDCF